jgi:chromate transporter
MTLSPELATCVALFGHFMLLSLFAVGGALGLAPEMHRFTVTQLHLLTDSQFSASIAIAQAAPGPNVLFVAILGYQAAGFLGAAATLFGIMLPSTTLAFMAGRWGHARAHWRGVQAFKAGMAPITIALLFATGWVLSADVPGVVHLGVTALVAMLVWRTRIHFLWLILAGAVGGMLGWV